MGSAPAWVGRSRSRTACGPKEKNRAVFATLLPLACGHFPRDGGGSFASVALAGLRRLEPTGSGGGRRPGSRRSVLISSSTAVTRARACQVRAEPPDPLVVPGRHGAWARVSCWRPSSSASAPPTPRPFPGVGHGHEAMSDLMRSGDRNVGSRSPRFIPWPWRSSAGSWPGSSYRWAGLALLRRTWLNLESVWAARPCRRRPSRPVLSAGSDRLARKNRDCSPPSAGPGERMG